MKIDALMLDGWTPILLLGAIFIALIYFISRKVSRKTLYIVSLVISFLCLDLLIYSVFWVGGWEGMGLGAFTISVLLGTWIGTIIGVLIKK